MLHHFNQSEKKATLFINVTIFFRMLGLFFLLPILSVMAEDFSDSTGFKIGLALGIYGLMQGMLQIPLGYLSDRLGRKKVALAGLSMFFAGSVFGMFADSIFDIFIARFLQGSGAIASVTSAWLSDILRPQNHRLGFMFLGIFIGFAFVLSIFLVPVLSQWLALNDFFFIISVFSVISMLILFYLEEPKNLVSQNSVNFKELNNGYYLIGTCVLGFCMHALLPGLFLLMPKYLASTFFVPLKFHGWIYLLSILFGLPILYGITKLNSKRVSIFLSLICVFLGLFLFKLHAGYLIVFVLGIVFFFVGFNSIEAALPTYIASISHQKNRGLVMGCLMTSEFFGAFLGSLIGGYLLHTLYKL